MYLVAFVDITAMLTILRQYVTVGTLANETADCVPASAVATEERHYSTLVNV